MGRSTQLLVKGHTLLSEGRVRDIYGFRTRYGKGQCSCGAVSDLEYASTAARQRWHRGHKLEVLREREKIFRPDGSLNSAAAIRSVSEEYKKLSPELRRQRILQSAPTTNINGHD